MRPSQEAAIRKTLAECAGEMWVPANVYMHHVSALLDHIDTLRKEAAGTVGKQSHERSSRKAKKVR